MKGSRVILTAIGLVLGFSSLHAQDSSNALRQVWDPQLARTTAQSVVFQTEMVRRLFGIQVQMGGPVTRAVRAGKPWQLINPLAPAGFGDGFDNLSIDPQTGQPTGLRLLDIRF